MIWGQCKIEYGLQPICFYNKKTRYDAEEKNNLLIAVHAETI